MSLSDHRSYQFFGLKGNKIVHIETVDSGLLCKCVCPYCHNNLVAKKGKKNIHHFAHISMTGAEINDCSYGNQTALHIIAKEILLNDKFIMLPVLFVSAVVDDVNGRSHRATKNVPAYKLSIESVGSEVILDGIIPDIHIRSGEKELLVEIVVTNFPNRRKIDWLKQHNKAAIQIDLSVYYKSIGGRDGKWDYGELRSLILEAFNCKSWLHNPKEASIYNSLLEQAKAEASKIQPTNYDSSHHKSNAGNNNHRDEPAIKQGICELCGQFTNENDWWMFNTPTMTCKCNKCLRGGVP